ncbi:hypothetical protein Esti_005838 [Eimeria stiedai]
MEKRRKARRAKRDGCDQLGSVRKVPTGTSFEFWSGTSVRQQLPSRHPGDDSAITGLRLASKTLLEGDAPGKNSTEWRSRLMTGLYPSHRLSREALGASPHHSTRVPMSGTLGRVMGGAHDNNSRLNKAAFTGLVFYVGVP